MNIYIDETIHEHLGFMILAYVLCPNDPQADLARVLDSHRKDEFHALEKMDGNNQAKALRSEMRSYLNWNCRWGVFVLPSEVRWRLSEELVRFVPALVETCSSVDTVSVFMDEGIVKESALEFLRKATGIERVNLGKSHEINGIQLADLVAALCGVRLREEISQKPKMLQYGDEAGFEPPIEAKLSYELWASLRYSMHRSPVPLGEDLPKMAEFWTSGFGFFVSDKCSPELRAASEKLFGQVYLGCIH